MATSLRRAGNQKPSVLSNSTWDRLGWSPVACLGLFCIVTILRSRRSIFSTKIGVIDCAPISGMLDERSSMIVRYSLAMSTELGSVADDEGSSVLNIGIERNPLSARSRI